MKVSQESTGNNLTSLIKIEIEKADYQPSVDKQLKDYRKKANIPGFRVGQVPLSMIKKMYQTSLMAQEIEKLMSDNLYKYIDDNKIEILASPMANDDKTPKVDFEKDENFTFYFDIAINPKIDLDLKSIATTLYDIQPEEKQVDKFIEDTLMRFGQVTTPETIGPKDMVYGELTELDPQGQKKEEGLNIKTTLYVERITNKEVSDLFLDKKVNDNIEFCPNCAFEDDNFLASFIHKSKEEVKDFTAKCSFSVLSIQRMAPAQENEELYNKVYPNKNIKDSKQFRAVAIEDLKKTYVRESDSYFLNTTSESLVKNVKFDIPEEFLRKWLLVNNTNEQTSKSQIEENMDKYLEGIRWQIIENHIAQQFNISVKEEDMVNYYKNELLPMYFPKMDNETEEQTKQREDHMNSIAQNMLKEKEQGKQVYNYLFDRQMIQVLKDNTKMSKKELSMDEFIKQVTPKQA